MKYTKHKIEECIKKEHFSFNEDNMQVLAEALGFKEFTPKQKEYLMDYQVVWDRQEGATTVHMLKWIMNLNKIYFPDICYLSDRPEFHYKVNWFRPKFLNMIEKLQEAKILPKNFIQWRY